MSILLKVCSHTTSSNLLDLFIFAFKKLKKGISFQTSKVAVKFLKILSYGTENQNIQEDWLSEQHALNFTFISSWGN